VDPWSASASSPWGAGAPPSGASSGAGESGVPELDGAALEDPAVDELAVVVSESSEESSEQAVRPVPTPRSSVNATPATILCEYLPLVIPAPDVDDLCLSIMAHATPSVVAYPGQGGDSKP
jgi:hypothetical protein